MTRISNMTTRIVLTGLVIATGFAAHAAGDGQGKMGGKMHKERPAFSTLDADGNGELTKEELATMARARFDAADTNGDGNLSAEEIVAAAKERAEKRGKDRSGKMMDRMDANDDGMISFEEMSNNKRGKRADKMFDRMDADNSGTISEEEYAEMKGHRGGHGKRKKMRGDN